MENKHKNVVIVVLVALVLVLAVGYAAFAQQLQINGTATITSKWDVHFDQTKSSEQDPSVVSGNPGVAGATAPSGTLTFTDGHNAEISANLIQPGDTVTYNLTIENGGNITAALATPTISIEEGADETNGLTVRKGNIEFTVSNPADATLTQDETTTMTVTAKFVDEGTVGNVNGQSATVNITLNATQATA